MLLFYGGLPLEGKALVPRARNYRQYLLSSCVVMMVGSVVNDTFSVELSSFLPSLIFFSVTERRACRQPPWRGIEVCWPDDEDKERLLMGLDMHCSLDMPGSPDMPDSLDMPSSIGSMANCDIEMPSQLDMSDGKLNLPDKLDTSGMLKLMPNMPSRLDTPSQDALPSQNGMFAIGLSQGPDNMPNKDATMQGENPGMPEVVSNMPGGQAVGMSKQDVSTRIDQVFTFYLCSL